MLKRLNIVFLFCLVMLSFALSACQNKSNLPANLRSLEIRESKDFSGNANNMYIKQFYVPGSQSNVYLIACKDTKQAALIDYGGYGTQAIDKYLKSNGLTLKALLLTHGHSDHIWGSALIQNVYHVPVYIHNNDKNWFQSIEGNYRRAGINHKATPSNIITVKEGDQINIGKIQITVMHTPGHSKGSVCYYIPFQRSLFTGDTLFKQAVGRYTFSGGSKKDLKNSVLRLLTLPEYTNVYAGHLEPTTIKNEKQDNMVYSF